MKKYAIVSFVGFALTLIAGITLLVLGCSSDSETCALYARRTFTIIRIRTSESVCENNLGIHVPCWSLDADVANKHSSCSCRLVSNALERNETTPKAYAVNQTVSLWQRKSNDECMLELPYGVPSMVQAGIILTVVSSLTLAFIPVLYYLAMQEEKAALDRRARRAQLLTQLIGIRPSAPPQQAQGQADV